MPTDSKAADVTDTDLLIRAWIAHEQYRGHSTCTIRRRGWSIRQWRSFNDDELDHLGPAEVEAFLARWVSPASRRAILGDLRSLHRFAVARGYLEVDPTRTVDTPKVPKNRPTPISAPGIRRLLRTTIAPVRTMIAIGAYAGLRVSEIAALHTDDVDLNSNVLAVRHGKGGKDRFIPVAPRLAGELAGWPPGPYFTGISGVTVSRRISRALRSTGLANHRPHDLRAAFATELARITGGNLVLIAELMGHESIETTRRYVLWDGRAAVAIGQLFAA